MSLNHLFPDIRKGRFNKLPDLLKPFFGGGFVPENQDGLGVGSPYQAPSIIKENPDAIDVDPVILLSEMFGHPLYHGKLQMLRAFDPDLRGGKSIWDIGQQLRYGFSGF